jgi:hypothetical protein
MKRYLAVLIVAVSLFGLTGCASLSTNVPFNIATDVAFVLALEKYPAAKPAVVKELQGVKTFLSGSVTYDALVQELFKRFGAAAQYKYIYVIITAYLNTDKPIFETWLPMFDTYKQEVIKKIDRLLLLAV